VLVLMRAGPRRSARVHRSIPPQPQDLQEAAIISGRGPCEGGLAGPCRSSGRGYTAEHRRRARDGAPKAVNYLLWESRL